MQRRTHTWTKEQEQFIVDNINKLSIKEIAKELNRTSNAINLFIHRKRIVTAGKVKRNLIIEMLTEKFTDHECFAPNRKFYDSVQIGQKRWWALYYGKKVLEDSEYKRLSKYFNIELKGIESAQLTLF